MALSRLPELRGTIFSSFLILAPWEGWMPVKKLRPADIDQLGRVSVIVDKWSI